jgi:cell division protease FtsH
MKNKTSKVWLLFVILFAFVLFRTISSSPTSEEVTEISYPELVRMIENGSVSNVELDQTTPIVTITTSESVIYTSTIPNEEIFLNFVQKQIESGKDINISTTQNTDSLSKASSIISFIVWGYFGFMIFLIVIQVKRTLKFFKGDPSSNNSGKQNSSTPSFMSVFNTDLNYTEKVANSDVRFIDVAGLDEEKQELEEVVDFIKNPDKYTKLGAKIPKGVLLSGSPGTGKTLLAKAVAGEAGVKYLAISGSEFIEKYVGVGASRIRGLFKEARKNAPCIIFIDEIDAVGSKRNDSGNSEHNQTIEQLLAEMDGFGSKRDVIVLAATNRLSSLDPALTRPGRFDRKIHIGLPDIKGRRDILKIHSKDKPLSDDVDLEKIAYNTAGFSGAELENLLNESALVAARKAHAYIICDDIDEALKKITVGLKKAGRVVSDKERILTANHEAGHALVSKFLKTQATIKEVSIVPRGTAGGYTWHDRVEDKSYISKTEMEERLTVLLAGRAAEQIVLGDISTGASNDLEVATKTARDMIIYYGMDSDIGPISFNGSNSQEISFFGNDTLSNVGTKIKDILKEAQKQAEEIINKNRAFLDELAESLLINETITGEEIDEMFTKYM